ncbi:hypothetical protein BZG36_00061 [Bifiguratus adelaidae]|uniref:Tyrosine specific protein phosphatases domain-containing protein n=1 Tax=Bifiguratus adelaidae TaxID=1938954 RepID=A0A261Y8B3_9FUNG|nr:hypothetical protein BZG36_00061 [Bifiguratus adelaidae]
MWNSDELLSPPFRFAIVEEGLFRGAYPKQRNLRFLKRLKLRTFLSLTPSPLDDAARDFCKGNKIECIHLQVDRWKEDNVPLTYKRTVLAIQYIINPDHHPLYLHCLDGSNVTGLVIACMRRLQLWTLASTFIEYSHYLRTSGLSSDESEFIERFNKVEIVIPRRIPPWLWGGQVPFDVHPILKLKFTNLEMDRVAMEREKGNVDKRAREKEDYRRRKEELLGELLDKNRRPRTTSERNKEMKENESLRKQENALKKPERARQDAVGVKARYVFSGEYDLDDDDDYDTEDDLGLLLEDESGDEEELSLTIRALALEGVDF